MGVLTRTRARCSAPQEAWGQSCGADGKVRARRRCCCCCRCLRCCRCCSDGRHAPTRWCFCHPLLTHRAPPLRVRARVCAQVRMLSDMNLEATKAMDVGYEILSSTRSKR